MVEYLSENDMLRLLESPSGNADALVTRICEKQSLLDRLAKLSSYYSPPSTTSVQQLKAKGTSDDASFTGSDQEIALISATANILHIDELLALQLWTAYVSQLLTKPSVSSALFTSPSTLLDLCQLHYEERQRTWKLLQEMLRIDNDREHVLHDAIAELVQRLLQRGLMANLLKELSTLYSGSPIEFQSSYVSSLKLGTADTNSLKRNLHSLWIHHRRQEVEYALETMILLYYRRDCEIDVLLRCVELAVVHQFSYPAHASGETSILLSSRWIVLFVELFQFWRSNCMESAPVSHPLVSMQYTEAYDKIQNLLHKNLTPRNIALLPQSTLLLTWGFFLQTHSTSLASWSGQRHVGCYGQAMQYDVLGHISDILQAVVSVSDPDLYSLILHELVNCVVQYICIEKVQSKVNLSYIEIAVTMIATLYHQCPALCEEFFGHWKAAATGSMQVLPICYLLRLLSERSSYIPELFFRFVECLVVHEASATEMLLLLLSQVPLVTWLPYDAVKVETAAGVVPSQRYFSDSAKYPNARITLTSPLPSTRYEYFLHPDTSNLGHLVTVNADAGQALLQWNKQCSWFTILLSKLYSMDDEVVSAGLGLLTRLLRHFPVDALTLLSEQYEQLQLVMFLNDANLLELYALCHERNITLRNLAELTKYGLADSALKYLQSIPYTTINFRQHLSHIATYHLAHPSIRVSRRALNLLSALINSSFDAVEALAIFTDKFEFNSSVWYVHLLRMCESKPDIIPDIFTFFDAVLLHIDNRYFDIAATIKVVNGRVTGDEMSRLLRYSNVSAECTRDLMKQFGDGESMTIADMLHFVGSKPQEQFQLVHKALLVALRQQVLPQVHDCYHNLMLFCMEMIVSGDAQHVIAACEAIEKHFVRVVRSDSEYCIFHESLLSSFGIFVNALLQDARFQNAYSSHMLRLVHTALRHQSSVAQSKTSLKALLEGPASERSYSLLPVNFSTLYGECDVTTLEAVAQASMQLFTYVIQYLERYNASAIESYVTMLTHSTRSTLLQLLCYVDYPLSPVFSVRRYSILCELALNIVNDALLYCTKSSFVDILDVSNMSPFVRTLSAILTSTTESFTLKEAVLKHLITVTRVDTHAMLRLCLVKNPAQNESSIVHALDTFVQGAEHLHESSPELLHAYTTLILSILPKQALLEQIILKICRPRHFWDCITSPLMLSLEDDQSVSRQCAQLLVHRDVLLLLAQERYGYFKHMNESIGTTIERACDAFFEKAARAHRFVSWVRHYMKLSLPEWNDHLLHGTVEIVTPLQQVPNCINRCRVNYGDHFGVYNIRGDSIETSREHSLIHARLQLLQGWKRFIDIYVLPSSSSAMIAESDIGGLSPGRYSTGSDSPPDSPSLRKESSFVGDKRSYELLSEIMKHIRNVCPQHDPLNPIYVPTATLSVCADILHSYFELFVSMLHHQLKEISLRTFDPSYSEIHSRDIGNMRLTPSKMASMVYSLNEVCGHMQALLSIDQMIPTYIHCYSSLLLLLRALTKSSADGDHELPPQMCYDVYANVSTVFVHLSQQPLAASHMSLLQIMLRVYNIVLPQSLLHDSVGDSLQWNEILEKTSLKSHLVSLFKATMNFDNISDIHSYSWLGDAALYPQGSSTAQISITTNTSRTPPPPELNILLSLLDIFIHKPTLCYDAELLPIVLQAPLLIKYQSLLHEDNNCLMPYQGTNGEPALTYLCVKKVVQYVSTLVPALAEVNRLEKHAHFVLQFSHTYAHLLYTFLPSGKVRISNLQMEMTKEILYLFAVLHRYIPSWRIAHTGHHASIVMLLSYISFLVGGVDEHYAIAHQRILHGASIAISKNEKYEEKSLTTRPQKLRKIETPERSLVKVALPMERTTSGTISDTWKQLIRQGTDESSSIKHSMKFLDELVNRLVHCLHPLLLCIRDITPPVDTFMHAEHLVVGTEVYINTLRDVCHGQIIAVHDNGFDIQLASGVIERNVLWQQVAFTTPPLFDFGSKYDLPFAFEQFMRKSLHHPTTAHLVQLLQFLKQWHEENCQYVTRHASSFGEIDMIVSEIVYVVSTTIAHHSVTICDLQQLLDQMQSIVELIEPKDYGTLRWLVSDDWDCVRQWVFRVIEFINSSTSENRSWTYALVETEKQSAKRGRGGGLREGVAFLEI